MAGLSRGRHCRHLYHNNCNGLDSRMLRGVTPFIFHLQPDKGEKLYGV